MSPAPVARVRGLWHRFGGQAAVADITLDIPGGCMAGLIGPDGVGKSTLLSLIAGTRRIQEGEVVTLDGDMARSGDRLARLPRIAYMPQGLGRNLYPTLSVTENLDFFGRLFGQGARERRTRITTLLEATGLDPFPDRPAGKLSGGMRQKLALCCALIHDPDLLILDEPTTGVDPLSRRQFWTLINRIRERRPTMSVLVATAYMEEAERFDWLAAMDDGRVIAQGTPAELRRLGQCDTLDKAFINLLPAAKRARHHPVIVPPRGPDEGPAAIEAVDLTCRFGDFVAVDKVNFTIARGEIFGFLGSNGCGKSTTMKMLTGLLRPSSGTARLFGAPLDAGDMETRRRVGYMSQSFSLYAELTVRQNLDLHAALFRLPAEKRGPRVEELLQRFELADVADARPEALPLGMRQRLQLAVAVLHGPEILILDEPTSGVDPIARDSFWGFLVDLSRRDGVTIFLSTHFMNEAERCDRISLMHAGRVLAVGTAAELMHSRGAPSLEDAFIGYLEEASGPRPVDDQGALGWTMAPTGATAAADGRRFDPGRLWAYARREGMELLRDPIRLAFALLGPVILLLTFGYGISFDVENLSYAVLDQDQTHESREFLETFSGSRYFQEHAALADPTAIEARLKTGELKLAIEIPPNFGRDLVRGRQPEVNIWLDGAMPFRAETARGYVDGLFLSYLADQAARHGQPDADILPTRVVARYRYNQAFKSVFAMVPSVMTLLLVLIPAMTAAIGVVREKEMGSIANFRATPITREEFLIGKQLPYIAIGAVSYVLLVVIAWLVFGVTVRGSALALGLGVIAYLGAATGFGLLVSSFTRTQVAATFATAILSMVPAINFSGLLTPVSSLSGGAHVIGLGFPASWFQEICAGTFTKGMGLAELWPAIAILGLFTIAYLILARMFLRKQEA